MVPLPRGPPTTRRVGLLVEGWDLPLPSPRRVPLLRFVIGGALPVTLAALAGRVESEQRDLPGQPAPAVLVAVDLRWMMELLWLPAARGRVVRRDMATSGTGRGAPRGAGAGRLDVEADGLFGAPPVTVVVGGEAHPTLFKSLGMLGFGRSRVVRVPVDNQGRMRAEGLPQLDGPAIVCLQAGNVNTGAFDPFPRLAWERARRAPGCTCRVRSALGAAS